MTHYRFSGGIRLTGLWKPKWTNVVYLPYWKAVAIIGSERYITGTSSNARVGISVAAASGHVAIGSTASAGNVWVADWGTTDYGSTVNLNGDNQNASQFGASIAIAGSWLAVGAPQYLTGSTRIGAVYMYQRGSSWTNSATRVTAPSGNQNNLTLFGTDLALYGTTLVVGAPGYNSNYGNVEVYDYSGGSWTHTTTLSNPSATNAQEFGYSVAIFGNTMAVGAPYENNSNGAVYIFTLSGGTWGNMVTLESQSLGFGWSVSLASATDLAVGAPGSQFTITSTTASANGGAAYVYSYSGGSWNLTKTINVGMSGDGAFITDTDLLSTGNRNQNRTGWSIAYYQDTSTNSTLIIGAPRNEGNAASGSVKGAVYICENVNGTWEPSSQNGITNSKIPNTTIGTNAYFGYAVAYDSERIIATSIGESTNRGSWWVYKE